MKIVKIYTLKRRGSYVTSEHWKSTREQIHAAIRRCEWPVGSGSFTIYPESGKARGEGNGVKPIRDRFVQSLQVDGWTIEGNTKNALDERLGDFDAVLPGPEKPIVVEWETGDIASPHLSMNILMLLLEDSGDFSRGIYAAFTEIMCISDRPNRLFRRNQALFCAVEVYAMS